MAYGGETFFIADKIDPGMKATKSFMIVEEDKDKEKGPLKYIIDDEKIIIKMPKYDFQMYRQLYNNVNYSSIFHVFIVYPALLYALSRYFKNKEYSNNKWAQALEQKKDEKGLAKLWYEQFIPELSQKLIDNPVERGLQGIENIMQKTDQEGN